MHVPFTHFPGPPGSPIVLSAAVTIPANVARAISIMEAAGEGYRVPLFRAVMHDQLAISHIWPDQAAPVSRLDRTGRPALLLISDDDDITRRGPDGWVGAVRALRWANAVIVHAAAGLAHHYDIAVEGTLAHRRMVVVETSSALAQSWVDAALRLQPDQRILRIEPPPGQVHPVPMGREHFQ